MGKHRMIIEIDVDENGSFFGELIEALHPEEMTEEDNVGIAYTLLHLANLTIDNLNGLSITNDLHGALLRLVEANVHDMLNVYGIVSCSHMEDDETIPPYFKFEYTAGLSKERLN